MKRMKKIEYQHRGEKFYFITIKVFDKLVPKIFRYW